MSVTVFGTIQQSWKDSTCIYRDTEPVPCKLGRSDVVERMFRECGSVHSVTHIARPVWEQALNTMLEAGACHAACARTVARAAPKHLYLL